MLVCGLLCTSRLTDPNWIQRNRMRDSIFYRELSLSLFDKNNKFISDRLKSLLRKKEEQRRRHFYDERRHIVEVDKCDCWSDYSIYYHLFSHKGTHKRTPHDYDSQRLSIYLCWNHRSLWMWFLPRFGCVFCVCDLRISILSVNYYFIIIFLLCVAFDMLFISLVYSTAETEDRREAGNTVQYYYYCCYSRFTGPKLKSWMLNDEKNTFFSPFLRKWLLILQWDGKLGAPFMDHGNQNHTAYTM